MIRRPRTRTRPSTSSPNWGGRRPGAGRPSLFSGRKVKLAVRITDQARSLIRDTRQTLTATHGAPATDGAVVEYLIRVATATPLDLAHPPVDRTKKDHPTQKNT